MSIWDDYSQAAVRHEFAEWKAAQEQPVKRVADLTNELVLSVPHMADEIDRLSAALLAAEATIARMRPVYLAAIEWRRNDTGAEALRTCRALIDAVDAAEVAGPK